MISLRHVDRVYPLKGGPYYALRNINLEVNEGDFLSIMGPSGSGKSTLLHILGLHDAAWEGEYTLCGEPVHLLDKKKRFALQKKTSTRRSSPAASSSLSASRAPSSPARR